MTPLLSIITATYNSGKTLEETIKSVLNQSYTNFEYIIIDGKSTDKTIAIIKKYEPLFQEKEISFKWVSEIDAGIYSAWNKGLKLASGSWISFLGSDDVYYKNILNKYVKKIEVHSHIDFIYSKVKLIKDGKVTYLINNKWNWSTFKRQMKIAHVGAFHNKNFFEKYGNFNEDFMIVGDYEMLLRAGANLKTFFLDEYTAEMKDGGISNNNIMTAFKEVRKAKIETAKISKSVAFYDFYLYIVKYYLSKFLK